MKHYRVNEIFYSLQGEGVRAGAPSVFVRFAGCNLRCARDGDAGFDCDTEFSSGRDLTAAEVGTEVARVVRLVGANPANVGVIFTGGEPMLQLDDDVLRHVREKTADANLADGAELCLETNGTQVIPTTFALDHVVVSPKSAEHTIRAADDGHTIHELRYVRRAGMAVPRPSIGGALHHVLSPAAQPDGTFIPEDVAWCVELCRRNPPWRLSMQLHKIWGVR